MKNFFRAYDIERDSDGLPTRMVWLGDYERVTNEPKVCAKCGSRRMVAGRCFECWWDGREEQWVEKKYSVHGTPGDGTTEP